LYKQYHLRSRLRRIQLRNAWHHPPKHSYLPNRSMFPTIIFKSSPPDNIKPEFRTSPSSGERYEWCSNP
jgi:hypothetical protein